MSDTSNAPHPEASCERCGRPNPVWFASSPLWNKVMADKEWGIVCPSCFAELAEADGCIPTSWKFEPEAIR